MHYETSIKTISVSFCNTLDIIYPISIRYKHIAGPARTAVSGSLPPCPAMGPMTGDAPFVRAVNRFGIEDLAGMAPEAIHVDRLDARMRLMAFVTIEPRHWHLLRERCPGRIAVAGKTTLPVRNEAAGLLGREGMAHHAGLFLHAYAMDLPVLMAPEAGVPVRPERMHGPLVAVFARELFHVDMSRMSDRFVHRYRSLGDIVPMAFDAGLPGCRFTVRFRGLSVGGEHKFDQQAVLFEDPQLMAVLANDVPVSG